MNGFIPRGHAKELKELGFNEPCFGYYIETGEWVPASYSREGTVYPRNSDMLFPETFSAPTYEQAFKWFRENHGLYHEILVDRTMEPKFAWAIHELVDHEEDSTGEWREPRLSPYLFHEYEEAELVCLIDLIRIVKQKL